MEQHLATQLPNPNRLGVVVGLFHDTAVADAAVSALKHQGFGDERIDIEQGAAATRALNGGLLGTLGRLLGIERGKYQNFVDTLLHLGITEDMALALEQRFRDGDELVSVRAGERAAEALALLERHGAETRFESLPITRDGYPTDAPSPDSAESGLNNPDIARRSEEVERRIP
jgi:hypothetical protein